MHHPYPVGMAYRAATVHYLLLGDWVKGGSVIEQEIAVLRTGNIVAQLASAVAGSAWVLAQLGEVNEALNRLREGEDLLEREASKGSVGPTGAGGYHWLGCACLVLGRLDDAFRLGNRAMDGFPRYPGVTARALHLLGDIATHPDRFDSERAESRYREALALAEPRRMRPLVAHCHLGLGKLYQRSGNRQEAREHLATAMTMYRAMGMTYWLERAEAQVN